MYQNYPLENESSILISIEDFMMSTCHEQFIDDHEEFKRELLDAVCTFKVIYKEDFTYSKIINVFKRKFFTGNFFYSITPNERQGNGFSF